MPSNRSQRLIRFSNQRDCNEPARFDVYRYRIVAIALILIIALPPTRGLVADEIVSMETIRAAIRDHVSSVTSISTKYRLYYKYGPIAAYRDVFGGKSWGPQQREWAEQGSQKLLSSDPVRFDSGGLALSSSWLSYDGTTGYNVTFDPSDLSRPMTILETPNIDRSLYGQIMPADFAGLRIRNSDEKLPDLLAAPEARADGVEVIDGATCWRIDVGTYHMWSNPGLMHLQVAFDPTHGYLPRRIVIRVSPKDPELAQKLKQGMLDEDFEVVDYQRVHDQLQGSDRWFPHECRHRGFTGEFRYVIDEVLLNGTIPIDRFRPRPQNGTEIHHGLPKAGEAPNSYIFGGPAVADAIIQKRVAEAGRLRYEVAQGEALLDARDPGSFFSSRLLFWCSLALMTGIGSWQIARRIRPRQT